MILRKINKSQLTNSIILQMKANKINKKNLICHIRTALSIVMLISITACGDSAGSSMATTENVTSKAGSVQLYHATETAVEPDDDRYQLVQPDNLSAALEEVIENMTLSSKMTIEKYLIDENRNITLFIDITEDISEEEILLNQAAIIKSIQGIDVGEICITLQDQNENEVSTATYTDASFYYYDE